MNEPVGFRGFLHESAAFLKNVRMKNSKAWFDENRSLYEKNLLEPFKKLVRDLTPVMLEIDPEFEVRPLINRTISTIYRDTRFSRDKSLFKDTMWLTFKRTSSEWKDVPAYYFEITPTFYRYGMGFYSASRTTMDRFRESVDDHPESFRRAISFFGRKGNPFELAGETYKRPPSCIHPHGIREWYQMKTFYLVCSRKIDQTLFSSKLAAVLSNGFQLAEPLYRYLVNIK